MTDKNENTNNLEETKETNISAISTLIINDNNKNNDNISENKFLTDLHKMMTNPECRKFYDDYFHDFVDVKVAVLYMKLYEKLQIEYKKRNNCDIEPTLLLYVIREVMNDNVSRKKVFENYEHFIKNNDPHFLDIFFEKKIKN